MERVLAKSMRIEATGKFDLLDMEGEAITYASKRPTGGASDGYSGRGAADFERH
jgi:hypothetical protein